MVGETRLEEVRTFLKYRGVHEPAKLQTALHQELRDFPTMCEISTENATMYIEMLIRMAAAKIRGSILRAV